jgi:N-acylglucosamine-6-phosphate 2-epimerase
VAEGGFWYPEQVVEALELGVWAVVVGSAITRPLEITRRFVRALQQAGLQ